jgi:hypothetical protein
MVDEHLPKETVSGKPDSILSTPNALLMFDTDREFGVDFESKY